MGADRRQEIAIGWFVAQAIFCPGKFHNVALSLAGEEVTQLEGVVIFEVVGKEMPVAPCFVGSALKFFMKEALGTMFQWFRDVGYGADVEECRKMNPQTQDYQIWLKENSSFVKKREYECAACVSRHRYISYVDI